MTTFDQPPSPPEDLGQAWRTNLLNRLIWVLLALGIPLLIYAWINEASMIWLPNLIIVTILIGLAALPVQFYSVRAAIFSGLLVGIGLISIFTNGVMSSGLLYMILGVVFSSMLLGASLGLLYFSISIIALIVLASLTINGIHQVNPFAMDVSSSTLSWIFFIAGYTVTTAVALTGSTYIINHLEQIITRLQNEMAEREDLETAELASLNHIQFLTENASDVIWTMDLEMNFTYISPSIEVVQGYTVEEAMAMGLDVISNPDSLEELATLLNEELSNDADADPSRSIRLETTLHRKNGGLLDVEIMTRFIRDDKGEPIGIHGISRDITERKQLEVAMASVIRGTQTKFGANFFHSLTENLATVLNVKCVLIGERRGDTIKTVSVFRDNKIIDNFGYSVEGTPCNNVIDRTVCLYPHSVQTEFPDDEMLVSMGMDSYLGAPIFNSEQETIGILACLDDKPQAETSFGKDLVTIFAAHAGAEFSRQKIESENELVKGQLMQAQKLESIGQLAGGVAHDFNNLLVVIQGYVDLAEDLTDDAELIEYHKQIRGAADRATDLTRQLLSFSRRQIMETRPLNLNDLLNHVGGLLQRLLPENIAYEFIPSVDLGIIEGDQGQLEQVVVNLAVNARDAMPNGGRLTIETENIVIDQNYVDSHPWAQIGRHVLLRVYDTGVGIPEEAQSRVFEPFYTTKPEGLGTGLGLSVLFGVVKQHGGFVHLYSELDKGTEFRVYFPIVERTASSLERRLKPRITRGTETLLLVEDDDQVRALARTFLTRAGYSVIVAEDGEIAIERFKEHKKDIALAILDVVLPKAGGHEVMAEIHKIAPDLPVLFSSGYSANGIHTNFILEDDLLLLQKPYSRDELLSKVREMLD